MLVESPIDFSQYGQPSFIKQFIPLEAPRWVIDVGAHDGIDGSNSRGFILDGWTAVLIEPLPAVFDALKRNSADLSNVFLEQCACAETEGVAQFYIGSDGPNGQTSSLCQDDVWKPNRSGEEITVRVRTLTNLLTSYQCPPDFAVLLVDAEGMDFEVLSSLDFSRFKPAVICTETYLLNQVKNEKKAELLQRNGYRLQGALGSDRIWTSTNVQIDDPSVELFSGTDLPASIVNLPTAEGVAFFDHASLTDGVLTISGWAMAPDQSIPGVMLLAIKTPGGFLWQQSARHPRADVAAHFQNSGLLFTGFVARFPFSPAQSQVTAIALQVRDDLCWETEAVVTLEVARL